MRPCGPDSAANRSRHRRRGRRRLLFTLLTTRDAVGLDVFGLVVTLAGAGAVLIVYHMFFPHVRKA
jgi:hypothetical protein